MSTRIDPKNVNAFFELLKTAQISRHSEWLVYFRASVSEPGSLGPGTLCLTHAKRKVTDACDGWVEVWETHTRCMVLRTALPLLHREVMHWFKLHNIKEDELGLVPTGHWPSPDDVPFSQLPARIGSAPSMTVSPATATPRGTMEPSASSANEPASAASAGAHREALNLIQTHPINLTSPKEWPHTQCPSWANMKFTSMLAYLPLLKKLESDRLGRALGEGYIGRVFESERRGASVALKVIDFSTDRWKLSSAAQEVLAFSTLPRHPNVIELMDLETAGPGTIILVLPLLDRTLDARQGRKVTPEELLFIADSVVAGLHHLHSHGLIHGDLKPRNILVKGAPYPELEFLSWSSFASAVAGFDQTICLADLDAVGSLDPVLRARVPDSDFFCQLRAWL